MMYPKKLETLKFKSSKDETIATFANQFGLKLNKFSNYSIHVEEYFYIIHVITQHEVDVALKKGNCKLYWKPIKGADWNLSNTNKVGDPNGMITYGLYYPKGQKMNKFYNESNEYFMMRCNDDVEVQINFFQEDETFGLIVQDTNEDNPLIEDDYNSLNEIKKTLSQLEMTNPRFVEDWDGTLPSIEEFRKLEK